MDEALIERLTLAALVTFYEQAEEFEAPSTRAARSS